MSTRFVIRNTPLAGLKVIRRMPLYDDRGYLERLFCKKELGTIVSDRNLAQINHTLTKRRGTVRGMHYQNPPHAESKLVSCLRGEVYDVAIDLRTGSKSFLHWHAETLTAENRLTLLVPEGFAHGFQALSDDCEILYFHTAPHSSDAERAVNARDPMISIDWPLGITEMSPRDEAHPMLAANFGGIAL